MRWASSIPRELIPRAWGWLDPGITPCVKTPQSRPTVPAPYYARARIGAAGKFSSSGMEGLVAKRAEYNPHSDPPRIVIKAVNPECPTYEHDVEETNIFGRVIWAARRL